MTDLAKRAVACKGWRWMPGMLCEGVRIDAIAQGGNPLDADGYVPVGCPDLDDPATLGCFEHGLLPAAGYNDAHLDAFRGDDGECVYGVVYRPDPVSGPNKWLSAVEDGSPSKAAALVAALEAAP